MQKKIIKIISNCYKIKIISGNCLAIIIIRKIFEN